MQVRKNELFQLKRFPFQRPPVGQYSICQTETAGVVSVIIQRGVTTLTKAVWAVL